MTTNNQSHGKALDAYQDLGSIISANLKRLIAKNGITQKDLAEQLGVAAASMTDYCKGRRKDTVLPNMGIHQ